MGEGVDVGESVSKGIGVGDSRGGAVMYVVGGSEGVVGVCLAAAKALAASEAIAAMETVDGDGIRLAAVRAAALGTTAARATEVRGSKRGQSEAARAAAWGDLVFWRGVGGVGDVSPFF